MISAFGVEHIGKSYTKLAPKLQRVIQKLPAYEQQSMDERIKLNYAIARQDTGAGGVIARKAGGTRTAVHNAKEAAKGGPYAWQPKKLTRVMVNAAGNRSKRKGRKLP